MIIESSSNTTLTLPDNVLKLSGKSNKHLHATVSQSNEDSFTFSHTPTSLAWHGCCHSRPAKYNL